MKIALLLAVLGLCRPAPERVVFLGDSITDGHTLPLLIREAIGDRAPVPQHHRRKQLVRWSARY